MTFSTNIIVKETKVNIILFLLSYFHVFKTSVIVFKQQLIRSIIDLDFLNKIELKIKVKKARKVLFVSVRYVNIDMCIS